MAQLGPTIIRGELNLYDGDTKITSYIDRRSIYQRSGTIGIYGDSGLTTRIDGTKLVVNTSGFVVGSAMYGTADPSSVVSNPQAGQIYFKIV